MVADHLIECVKRGVVHSTRSSIDAEMEPGKSVIYHRFGISAVQSKIVESLVDAELEVPKPAMVWSFEALEWAFNVTALALKLVSKFNDEILHRAKSGSTTHMPIECAGLEGTLFCCFIIKPIPSSQY